MAKKPDDQTLKTELINVVQDTFLQLCRVAASADPVVVEKDIIEYDGRMRISPMEKFNGPAYVAVANYYSSQKKSGSPDPLGTFVFYIREDMVEKLFKAFGRPVSEAEDEAKALDVVGQMCAILAGNLKNKLTGLGLADLLVSTPDKYKNSVPSGAPFDYSLFKKQEFSFSFWKEKCIVVEVCLGDIPVKGQ